MTLSPPSTWEADTVTLPTPTPPPAPVLTSWWAPRPAETALVVVGGLIMTAVSFTVDPTGRWLVWAAAAMLFAIAAMDVVVRPRLQADETGLTVRSLRGRTSAPWSQVEATLRQQQRFGRSVATIELDIDEELFVLGRRELGTDPEAVAAQLVALRDGGVSRGSGTWPQG